MDRQLWGRVSREAGKEPTHMAYFTVSGPKAESLPIVLKVLLPGLNRSSGRFGMGETAIILVHGISNLVHVPPFDPLEVRADEFQLRRAVCF